MNKDIEIKQDRKQKQKSKFMSHGSDEPTTEETTATENTEQEVTENEETHNG